MRNPITKLAIAAVIAVAGIAGIVMWTHTGSGIALANVLAQVQQVTAYMYQMTMTISGKAPNGQPVNQNMESTVLIAQDYGMKMTMGMADPNGGNAQAAETYMLPQEKTLITLSPATKQYMRVELDDTLIEKTRQQNYDPSSMLKQILDCKYESLGRSVVDGVEVEGFQTTDPNYLGGMMGQVDVKIWVDVKTQLPVRSEMDMQMGDMQIHGAVHNFRWNCPATAADFPTTIPAGYTMLPGSGMKMPAMNEESAIAGLKLCADLTGRYPEKLDFMTAASLMSKLEEKDTTPLESSPETDELFSLKERLDKTKELPIEERIKKIEEIERERQELDRKMMARDKKFQEQLEKSDEQLNETMDKLMPIQGTVMFYLMLAEEKKEPAYYGNVVTPQHTDKVLLRWKVSDNQYRVIFGGLHAETVDAATLAELEKNLPK